MYTHHTECNGPTSCWWETWDESRGGRLRLRWKMKPSARTSSQSTEGSRAVKSINPLWAVSLLSLKNHLVWVSSWGSSTWLFCASLQKMAPWLSTFTTLMWAPLYVSPTELIHKLFSWTALPVRSFFARLACMHSLGIFLWGSSTWILLMGHST